jgi:hypothetical protein
VFHAVTKSLPEIVKKPAEPWVNEYVHDTVFPEAFVVVRTPITVPASALLLTVKLLTVIMGLSHMKFGGKKMIL